ncbi:GSCFA domain-containing protein [soil metagenome]
MSSPYAQLPPRNFWRTGVSEQHPLTISDLYRKRFSILPNTRIATAGSCFAQHIATHLRRNGYTVIDAEPAPPGLSPEIAREYGYGMFSARYANVYCMRQMLQIAQEAYGTFQPADPIWTRDGRFFDAMRPSVEPGGLASADSVRAHRASHLRHVRKVLQTADLFVFTFGLTEAWVHRETGTCYPTAPGTIAGSYDPDTHIFKNFRFSEIYADFVSFRALIRRRNPGVKFLVTVSPVPLTATASSNHVLQASTYSKSVLRAVAGQLYEEFDDVDYFPSYEMVASPFSKGFFFESNLRSVNAGGVEAVMRVFFSEHPAHTVAEKDVTANPALAKAKSAAKRKRLREQVVCEEELLEAFAE